jgi:alkylation response protein AidB-like acyl-CoA dehydrogenase
LPIEPSAGTLVLRPALEAMMRIRELQQDAGQRRRALVAAIGALVPHMRRGACELDRDGTFPAVEIEQLRAVGALGAPVPSMLGGLGMGTEFAGALALSETLRLIGRGNLSVGRLFEAHVNALRLVVRYGTQAQARRASDDAISGHLFGLWVTDAHDDRVRIEDGVLVGAKAPCSGAGHLTRAVVTAEFAGDGICLAFVRTDPGVGSDLSAWDLHGMRASASGRQELGGSRADVVGSPGDYFREPDFSAGAWRTSAVTLGGLEALVAEMREALVARGRAGDPHQLTRVGEALIAQETARLWVRRAALVAEGGEADAEDVTGTVNLARIAVETCCLDVIRIAQRALGLSAFRRGTFIELLLRDLAVYLRQPAPDEALTEAAGHFMRHDPPDPL